MKLTFLEPLYTRPGPYACVYLDTSRDIDDPHEAIELRWRHLRALLDAQGADTGTMTALGAEVGTDEQVPGRHGQAIFASHGDLVLEAELPEPPVLGSALFAALPDTLPLALQHAPDIPYAAVAIHHLPPREPGQVSDEFDVAMEAGRWPTSAVAPGPRHHQRVPAADWVHTAPRVAEEAAELAEASGAESIVLAGDPWAGSVLAHRLPRRLLDRVTRVPGDGRAAAPGRALLEDQLGTVFRGRMSAADRERMERFLAQRARHMGSVEGIAASVAALQRGQAEALLLNAPVELPTALWAGAEPEQIALSREELESFGALSFEEGPAGAALVRALARTGAELVVVPRTELVLQDGVGVLLRYVNSVAEHGGVGGPR